jgi:hypothetical protein
MIRDSRTNNSGRAVTHSARPRCGTEATAAPCSVRPAGLGRAGRPGHGSVTLQLRGCVRTMAGSTPNSALTTTRRPSYLAAARNGRSARSARSTRNACIRWRSTKDKGPNKDPTKGQQRSQQRSNQGSTKVRTKVRTKIQPRVNKDPTKSPGLRLVSPGALSAGCAAVLHSAGRSVARAQSRRSAPID